MHPSPPRPPTPNTLLQSTTPVPYNTPILNIKLQIFKYSKPGSPKPIVPSLQVTFHKTQNLLLETQYIYISGTIDCLKKQLQMFKQMEMYKQI
jgi:hypothetical protein